MIRRLKTAKTRDERQSAKWNVAAFASYFIGASSTFFVPDTLPKSLVGLFVSMLVYFVLSLAKRKRA